MSEREIKARYVLGDIRAGMDDAGLMEKYRLSPRGLKSLYRELANLGLLDSRYADATERSGVTRIRVKEVVKDIRSGMKDAQLKVKYGLSSKALHTLFKKLLDLRAVSSDDVFGDTRGYKISGMGLSIRELDRYELDFELEIHDAFRPGIKGTVRDITEQGVGVAGIDAKVGEVKTFVVRPDEFLEIGPFTFRAECRWRRDVDLGGAIVAGFKITDISPDNLEAMRKLLGLLGV